jgi:hypothetical protein
MAALTAAIVVTTAAGRVTAAEVGDTVNNVELRDANDDFVAIATLPREG